MQIETLSTAQRSVWPHNFQNWPIWSAPMFMHTRKWPWRPSLSIPPKSDSTSWSNWPPLSVKLLLKVMANKLAHPGLFWDCQNVLLWTFSMLPAIANGTCSHGGKAGRTWNLSARSTWPRRMKWHPSRKNSTSSKSTTVGSRTCRGRNATHSGA